MNTKDIISFIIPAYNCENCLERCVNSIRKVSDYIETALEIVIVDDGSTDGTPQESDRLGDIVIHQKNAGVSAARNTGIEKASGEYIVFVDSDDYINPELLAELLIELNDNPQTDVAAFGILFDYYYGGKCYRSDELVPPIHGLRTREECADNLYALFEANVLSPVWNKVIKKELLLSNSVEFRTDMFVYEDLEFSLRLLNASKNWYFFKKPVYHYIQAETKGKSDGRIKKIDSLPEMIYTIFAPLKQVGSEHEDQTEKIILKLYLTLASQKIAVSSRNEITAVCTDFEQWINERGLIENIRDNDYSMLIYNRDVDALIAKRFVSNLRHKTAVAVKSVVGDFRKWHIKN